VKNPLRSEAEAFQFVIGTLVYFGLIVIAAVAGGRWWALGVFILESVVVLAWWFRARRVEAPVRTAPRHVGGPGDRRILVIANETVGGQTLGEEIRRRAEGFDEEVLVVSPALNSPLRHWTSDEDGARAAAQERLEASVARLAEAGVRVRGEVGDSEPLQALEDAVRTFGPDEIIISTHPEGRSHWLEQGLVEKARQRFDVPITHVVVDLAAEREEVR
jgi:nucleotide-binding universal stress UspA family protein